MKTHTTRRAIMAGVAAAPVVGLPAVAGAVSAAPMSDALAQAIERHKAAWAAFSAFDAKTAEQEEESTRLSRLDNQTLMALAETPCTSDAEFVAKLEYMVARHDGLWLDWADSTEWPDILAAIRQHTGSTS